MKTKFFAVIAFMLMGLSLNANAQWNEQRLPRFHMGIRGGLTLNSDTEVGKGGALFPTGGIGMDFRLAPIPLYLETGAYYMNKRVEWESTDKAYDDHYAYVPLLVSYHIYIGDKFCIQPFTGITLGYLTEHEMVESAARFGCGISIGRFYANMGVDIGATEHDWYNYDTGYSVSGASYNTVFMTVGFNWAGDR